MSPGEQPTRVARLRRFFWNLGAVVFWGGIGLGGLGWTMFQFMPGSMCESTRLPPIASHDGRWSVQVEAIDCGATTGFGTMAVVRKVPEATVWLRAGFDGVPPGELRLNLQDGPVLVVRGAGPDDLTSLTRSRGARLRFTAEEAAPQ